MDAQPLQVKAELHIAVMAVVKAQVIQPKKTFCRMVHILLTPATEPMFAQPTDGLNAFQKGLVT